ncbi:MAG: iron transporter [Nitrospiraceae bacterium]|nr:iron transporter [Nitrospiraceae bacterium]
MRRPPFTPRTLLAVIGPGCLVAATGVGAGDLATAGFAGSELGVAVLWAVVVGTALKFALNEGLARWQLATGTSLIEGANEHLGRPFQAVFLLYLLPWSFCVGAALMGACGVCVHAMLPIFDDAATGKLVFGVASSLLGLVMVQVGGYRLFQKIMGACIALMFVTVLCTAALMRPDWRGVLSGLAVPVIPRLHEGGLGWTIALMGGVGGTLTVLCYGYWIREEGREGPEYLATCRVDLAIGYLMTGLFGIAMVIIASQIDADGLGKGAGLVVALAERLEAPLGPIGRWVFLIGAFGAVFSSLLGVWQCVPYVFADYCALVLGDAPEQRRQRVSERSKTYRVYLLALALVPMLKLPYPFKSIQQLYAVVGAGFIPFLALLLLYLNTSSKRIGAPHRNRPLTNLVLLAALAFFAYAAYLKFAG